MPKTGTSALQAYLAANARALARVGILYPQSGRQNKGIQHGDLMREIAGRPIFKGNARMVADLDREIARRPHEVLLLSGEFIYNPLYVQGTRAVQDHFAARGYRLHVVTYLRDQPALMNSFYAQLAKGLREARGFDAFLDQRLNPHRAPGRVFRMERFLANTASQESNRQNAAGERPEDGVTHHFQPYAAEVQSTGIEPHFMDALARICAQEELAEGLADIRPKLRRVPRQNETCGPVQLAAARILGAEIAPRFTQPELARATVGVIERLATATEEAGLSEKAYSGLTPARVAQIRESLHAGNAKFAQNVWGTSWEAQFPRAEAPPVSNDLEDLGDADGLRLAAEIAARVRPEIEAIIQRRLAKGLI
ncbi:MAG: hypothetical protein AAFR46_13090 [Pseudomonadota bacterium]